MHDEARDLQIIMNVDGEIDLKLPFIEDQIKIDPLSKANQIRFLKSFDKSNEIFNRLQIQELQNHALFNNNLNNQQIFDIFKLLKSNKSLDEINQIFEKDNEVENKYKSSYTDNIQLILYQYMKSKYPSE